MTPIRTAHWCAESDICQRFLAYKELTIWFVCKRLSNLCMVIITHLHGIGCALGLVAGARRQVLEAEAGRSLVLQEV